MPPLRAPPDIRGRLRGRAHDGTRATSRLCVGHWPRVSVSSSSTPADSEPSATVPGRRLKAGGCPYVRRADLPFSSARALAVCDEVRRRACVTAVLPAGGRRTDVNHTPRGCRLGLVGSFCCTPSSASPVPCRVVVHLGRIRTRRYSPLPRSPLWRGALVITGASFHHPPQGS